MMIPHPATDEDGEWTCECGNIAEDSGFYPSTPDGSEVEPTPEQWDGVHMQCGKCGGVFAMVGLP